MYPNLFKISGELLPCVIHVASRASIYIYILLLYYIVAGQALSIYGDHSDVMSVRSSGMILLNSSDVQECQDIGTICHISTLQAKLPFIHFFDGFRISHEINTIEPISQDIMRELYDKEALFE